MADRLLIVDDEPESRRSLVQAASALGYLVSESDSAELALAKVRDGSVDVLLTDLGTPGMEGVELVRRAREASPATQAILVTGRVSEDFQHLASQCGALCLLSKPVTTEQLEAALQDARDSSIGYTGTVHGLSLVDMMQLYHLGRRSICLAVTGDDTARLHFRAGELIHAECGEVVGRDALVCILARPSGSIASQPFQNVPQTIDEPFDFVLMDSLAKVDEASRERASVVPVTYESDLDIEPITREKGILDMGKIDDACKTIVQEVDGGVACGTVDLDTGMLLGIFNNAGYSQSLNEIVAAACMDMFRGGNVSRIQQAVRAHRGVPEDGEAYFEEIHISSRHNYHFMKTIKGGKAVVVLVTTKNTNIGMGWASLKAQIPTIEPLVP